MPSILRPIDIISSLCRILAMCAFWLCWVGMAAAHASLTGAVPSDGAVVASAPSGFSLSFSEPVSPLALRLIKPDGSAVALDKFTLWDKTLEIEAPAGLAEGTHVVSWRVVSEDGHPVGGSVIFSIGAPSAAPPQVADAVDWEVRAALWLGKIGLYLGLFIGVGGGFALHWFVRDVRPGRRMVQTMLGIGLLATIVSAALQGLDGLGAPLGRLFDAQVWTTGLATSFGRTVVVMALASLLALVALVQRQSIGRWTALAAIVAGAAALALSGHASAAYPQWLTRPSVFLHAACIAIWVGALVPLYVVLRLGDAGSWDALRRFSRFIPVAVVVLILAGVVLAVVQVQRPSALIETAYGNVLLVKLGLLIVLFALAAANRWMFTAGVEAGDSVATRRMVRSIAVETMVVILVLAVAAAWRFTPPPRAFAAAAEQPASTHIHSDKAMADITVTPGRAGTVEVSAFLLKGDFDPLDAKEVTFVLSNPDAGIEPIKRPASKAADGRWKTENMLLPLPGKWNIRVDILISDFELARISGEIELRHSSW